MLARLLSAVKTIAECLADELINAARVGSTDAIKDELERVAGQPLAASRRYLVGCASRDAPYRVRKRC